MTKLFLSKLLNLILVVLLALGSMPMISFASNSVSFVTDYYEGLVLISGEAFAIEANLTEGYDAGSAKLYLGDKLICSAPTKISDGVYRFDAAASVVGKYKLKVQASYSGIVTSASIDVNVLALKAVSTVNTYNIDSFDLEEGTELSTANTGFGRVDAGVFYVSEDVTGTNGIQTIKIDTGITKNLNPESNSSSLYAREIEFDIYLTGNKAGFGFDLRGAGKSIIWGSTAGNYYYPLENGVLKRNNVKQSVGLSQGEWHTVKMQIIKQTGSMAQHTYMLYIDGVLFDVGSLVKGEVNDKLTEIHIMYYKNSGAEYFDNIKTRIYEPVEVCAELKNCTLNKETIPVTNGAISTYATALTATLSQELTTDAAILTDKNGTTVSGSTVTVDGTLVTANFENLAVGKYYIKLPGTSTLSTGNAIGQELIIPFACTSELLITSPIDGNNYNTGKFLTITGLVPDAETLTEVEIDGVEVASIIPNDDFTISHKLDISNLSSGAHTFTFTNGSTIRNVNVTISQTIVTSTYVDQDYTDINSNGTIPTVVQQGSSGAFGEVVNAEDCHSNAFGVFIPATNSSVSYTKSSFMQLINKSAGEDISNTRFVVEQDLYFEDAVNDSYWYEINLLKNVTDKEIYDANGKKLDYIRVYFYIGGTKESYISGGKVMNNIALNNNTWYHIKNVFDFINGTVDVYVDNVKAGTSDICYSGILTKCYIDDTQTTQVTVDNALTALGRLDGISFINAYHGKSSKHNTSLNEFSATNPQPILAYLTDNVWIYEGYDAEESLKTSVSGLYLAPKIKIEADGTKARANLSGTYSGEDTAAKLIICTYYEDAIHSMNVENIILKGTISSTVDTDYKEGCTVKVFIWNTDGITPLTESYEL